MEKTIIILERPGGSRLANQLLNFISIYGYCLENGYKCENFCFFEEKKQKKEKVYYSFFDYNDYFNFPSTNLLNKFIVYCYINYKLCHKLRLYPKYANLMKKLFPKQIIYSKKSMPFYIPPSKCHNEQILKIADKSNLKKIYFNGWLFRNPVGIEKYRDEIVEYFKPKKSILLYVDKIISPLKQEYSHIIGVHIRQGDYKKLFCDGKYYFNEKEVRKILDEYLKFSNKTIDKTIFIICSDEKVDAIPFSGLNFMLCEGNEAEDLFTLASCDAIIGSNSTFGAWASYYGNIPFFVFEKKMDWEYYRNTYLNKYLNRYFQNKKCSNANY